MLFLFPLLAFMFAVFLAPLLFVLYTSFDGVLFSFDNYVTILTGRLYYIVLVNTLQISALTSFFALLVAYPIAYHLSKIPPGRRAIFSMLVLVPFYTSILVKSFAFTVILGNDGIINQLLRAAFGPTAAVKLLFNRFGVIVGLVHLFVPFMVFPILTSLLNQNPSFAKAAAVMGAGSWRIFFKVVFPLSLPGVFAGLLLIFIMSMGTFVTSALLGGRGDMMIANLVDFHVRSSLDWPMASALAIVLLVISGVFISILSKIRGGQILA